MKQKKIVIYYIILSIVAAIMLLILGFYGSAHNININIYDRLLIIDLFIIICFFGISLAFFPGWYKKFTKTKNHKINNQHIQKINRKRKGHHPDCDQFKHHILTVNDKIHCAGCLGLALGSLLSIILGVIYVIFINKFSIIFYFLIFIGLILISLAYLEIIFPIRNAFVHVVANACLIIGFLLITINMLEITGNIIYAVISVIFSFLFLDTRIQLSSYHHTLICSKCNEKCKMY